MIFDDFLMIVFLIAVVTINGTVDTAWETLLREVRCNFVAGEGDGVQVGAATCNKA